MDVQSYTAWQIRNERIHVERERDSKTMDVQSYTAWQIRNERIHVERETVRRWMYRVTRLGR